MPCSACALQLLRMSESTLSPKVTKPATATDIYNTITLVTEIETTCPTRAGVPSFSSEHTANMFCWHV